MPGMALSGTVKRRVRSTLAADAYAVSKGVAWAQLLRFVLLELAQQPKPAISTLRIVERTTKMAKLCLYGF